MSKLDELRAELFKSEGDFVEKLKSADKASPEVRKEALARLNALYKYASIKGRGRFLEEMRIPGSWKKRKVAYDVCKNEGKSEEDCQDQIAKIPSHHPVITAWPEENSAPGWWSAPLTHLIGTYDPQSPPAGDLGDWRDDLDTPLAKGAAVVDDAADAIGDVVSDAVDDIADIGGAIDDAVDEQRKTIGWIKVGAAVAATAITGAVVYRIAKG